MDLRTVVRPKPPHDTRADRIRRTLGMTRGAVRITKKSQIGPYRTLMAKEGLRLHQLRLSRKRGWAVWVTKA